MSGLDLDMPRIDEDDSDGGAAGMKFDLFQPAGDSGWRPKGIDSFICEVRSRRGKLLRRGTGGPLLADAPAPGCDIRRAPALFKKINDRATLLAARDAAPGSPRSGESGSEGEMAPIALIPPSPPMASA